MFPGAHAATNPDRAAIVMAASGLTVSYRELDEQANRISQLFTAAGLAAGDHVAFCLENNAEFLQLCWAPTTPGWSTRRCRPA